MRPWLRVHGLGSKNETGPVTFLMTDEHGKGLEL